MSNYSRIPYSCQFIDEVIGTIKSLGLDTISSIYYEAPTLKNLEKIREIHSDLRDWGNEQYDKRCELEDDNSALLVEIEKLEDSIIEKNFYITTLERKIAELNDKIKEN